MLDMHPEPQENSDSDEKGAVNDQDTRRYPSRTQQRTKAVTKRGCASVKYWRSIHNPLAKNNKTSLLVVRPDSPHDATSVRGNQSAGTSRKLG